MRPDTVGPSGAAAASNYATNIAKMNKLAAAFGSEFFCFIQPARLDRNGQYRTFRETAASVLVKERIRHVDFNDERHRGVIADARFLDEMHLDGAGNRIMAEIAANEIRQAGLLRAQTGR
jgi:lysophospholipase L1-like esterase